MSEGIFKDRMNERKRQILNLDGTLKEHTNLGDLQELEDLKDFTSWIEEARKDLLADFPIHDQPYLVNNISGNLIVLDTRFAELKLANIVGKVLKWFGEKR